MNKSQKDSTNFGDTLEAMICENPHQPLESELLSEALGRKVQILSIGWTDIGPDGIDQGFIEFTPGADQKRIVKP